MASPEQTIRELSIDELPGLTTKSNARRPTPPGHAAAMNKRFPKHSEHGLRLREKQKLRFHYGLHEKQLRLFYQRAQRMPGDTGRNMLNLLEGRLDIEFAKPGNVKPPILGAVEIELMALRRR